MRSSVLVDAFSKDLVVLGWRTHQKPTDRLRLFVFAFGARHAFDNKEGAFDGLEVCFGLIRRHLRLERFDQLGIGHGTNPRKRRLAGLAVNRDANVHLGAVAALGGSGEAFFHCFDDQTGVDHLFAGHGLGGLEQFQLVCGSNCHFSGLLVAIHDGLYFVKLRFVHLPGIFLGTQNRANKVVCQDQLCV